GYYPLDGGIDQEYGLSIYTSPKRKAGERDGMFIPDDNLDAVAFLAEERSGKHVPVATAFFVKVDSDPEISFTYAVTARHVIENIRGSAIENPDVYIWVNDKD